MEERRKFGFIVWVLECEDHAFGNLSDQEAVWMSSGNLSRPRISRPLFLYF